MTDAVRKYIFPNSETRSITFLMLLLGQYRTNEVVDARVNFSQDSLAEIEGLLAVNRDFCKMKIAEKAPHSVPLNCAVLPKQTQGISVRARTENHSNHVESEARSG